MAHIITETKSNSTTVRLRVCEENSVQALLNTAKHTAMVHIGEEKAELMRKRADSMMATISAMNADSMRFTINNDVRVVLSILGVVEGHKLYIIEMEFLPKDETREYEVDDKGYISSDYRKLN